MTNSMSNIEFLVSTVSEKFKLVSHEVVDPYQLSLVVEPTDIHMLLSMLKSLGWIQLSYLSAIDWIDENKFELVYIVFNWDRPVYIQIRSKIDRTEPKVNTIMPIYPGAKYYERECYEFFGIHFIGNPDYQKQLILEGWDDMPPLRKDFDPKAYSDKKFGRHDYDKSFEVTDTNGSPQEKRAKREARANHLKGGKDL